MRIEEVAACLKWLALQDGRYGTGTSPDDLALKAEAWHQVLPVDLGPQQFQRLAMAVMEGGETVTTAALKKRFRESITPKHEQAAGGLRWVATPAQPEPPKRALGPGVSQSGGRPLTGPQTTEAISELGLIRNRDRHPSTAIRCPHCGARPFSPCVVHGTTKPLTQSPAHPKRIEAWVAANGHDGGVTTPGEAS